MARSRGPGAVRLGRGIKERVQQRRKELGLSQEKLAQRADMSVKTVQRIEWQRLLPDLETLDRLAQALDCGIADLLPDTLASEDQGPYLKGRKSKVQSRDRQPRVAA